MGGGVAGVGINSQGGTTAQAGVATTQNAGLMDLGAPVAESPSRTTTTTTSPTTAGNMEGGVIRTGAYRRALLEVKSIANL